MVCVCNVHASAAAVVQLLLFGCLKLFNNITIKNNTLKAREREKSTRKRDSERWRWRDKGRKEMNILLLVMWYFHFDLFKIPEHSAIVAGVGYIDSRRNGEEFNFNLLSAFSVRFRFFARFVCLCVFFSLCCCCFLVNCLC